ncbi:MAG: SprT family zinc-dependent metalloprotease [Candidatus Ozemobacteraceae bacterium]
MGTKFRLGDIEVDVVLKDIKNIHLSVNPPAGRVKISAPLRMKIDTIRVFAISKLGWIKQQQKKLREQERETPREYLARESHYVWGKRYLLTVTECDQAPTVELKVNKMHLRVRPGTDEKKKQAVVDQWYREQIKKAVLPLITKWEPLIGVKVARFFVQRMKTRWGSCNPRAKSIRINTTLAKKPSECLEYIVVHELAHLLEPTHNSRFVTLMDQFMPKWRFYREQLNRLPVSHEDWGY